MNAIQEMVLTFLDTNKGNAYSIRELAEMLNLPPMKTQGAAKSLVETGKVNRKLVGRTYYYIIAEEKKEVLEYPSIASIVPKKPSLFKRLVNWARGK